MYFTKIEYCVFFYCFQQKIVIIADNSGGFSMVKDFISGNITPNLYEIDYHVSRTTVFFGFDSKFKSGKQLSSKRIRKG